MNLFRCLPGVLTLLLAATALRAEGPHTPPAGSEERKAIMDAIREPCERDLKQKVIFNVEILKVCHGWAFAYVAPQTPENHDINWSRTQYAEAYKNGGFDPHGQALLRQKDDGSWKVLHFELGGMDSSLPYWVEHDGAPACLNK